MDVGQLAFGQSTTRYPIMEEVLIISRMATSKTKVYWPSLKISQHYWLNMYPTIQLLQPHGIFLFYFLELARSGQEDWYIMVIRYLAGDVIGGKAAGQTPPVRGSAQIKGCYFARRFITSQFLRCRLLTNDVRIDLSRACRPTGSKRATFVTELDITPVLITVAQSVYTTSDNRMAFKWWTNTSWWAKRHLAPTYLHKLP